jgi:peptidoglycan/xylan/chitin deacetylase (PgdA/CDA1 family)
MRYVRDFRRALSAWVIRRKASLVRHGAVLLYHRIASPGTDRWELSVSEKNFSEHLEVIKKYGTCLTLAELHTGLASGVSGERLFAVTFDDGYRDNLTAAMPALKRAGVPATVFVTTGTIGSGREFWWDTLSRVFLETPKLPARLNVRLADQPWSRELGIDPDMQTRLRAMDDFRARLMSLAADDIAQAVSDIAAEAGVDPRGDARDHPMDLDELRLMASSGQVEIGGHTRTHAALTLVPPEVAQREIAEGRRDLREWTGMPVDSFAAPFGMQNKSVAEAIRAAGFARACLVWTGVVTKWTDPFAIPRIHVPDMNGAAFERLVSSYVGRHGNP